MIPKSIGRAVWVTLLFVGSCEWNGTIQLDDERDTGSDQIGDEDGSSVQTQPDTVKASVHVPAQFSGTPTTLCGYLTTDVFVPKAWAHAIVCYPRPHVRPKVPLELVFPNSELVDLSGRHYVSAVLFVEGGAGDGEPPVKDVDYFGSAGQPVALGEEGTGIIDAGDIMLGPVSYP